jgi:hypothetical protein
MLEDSRDGEGVADEGPPFPIFLPPRGGGSAATTAPSGPARAGLFASVAGACKTTEEGKPRQIRA